MKLIRWILHLFGIHSWYYGSKLGPSEDYGRTCYVCQKDEELLPRYGSNFPNYSK